MPRAARPAPVTPLDPAIVAIVEALARDAARRDHAREAKEKLDESRDLRPVLKRPAKRSVD